MMTHFFAFPALVLAMVVAASLSGCSDAGPVVTQGSVPELVLTDTAVGLGTEAVPGRRVSVHYTGWLYDEGGTDKKGSQFDSSHNRGKPFEFQLGAGRVIQGWDQGVAGMRVGGKRTLMIPADLGYGARGAGSNIPPHASLVFDVELLAVR